MEYVLQFDGKPLLTIS